ncbi:MAG: hypothetical protein ACETWK_12735 [Candidatus Aminicenantaceae bacterium]
MNRSSGMKPYKWLCLAFIAVGLLSITGEFYNGYKGVNEFSDDAYYYIVTARNYVDYGFFTFDGINKTNGFHPLWMIITVFLYKLIGTKISLNLQIFSFKSLEILLFILILSSAALMSYRLKKKQSPFSYAFLGVILILVYPGTNNMFTYGMETTIAALFILYLYYGIVNDKLIAVAVLLPLLFLSRLDTLIFVVGPILLYFLLKREITLLKKIALSIPVVVTSLSYILYNYIKFGYLEPISGIVKSSFPVPNVQLSHLSDPILESWFSGTPRPLLYPNLLLLVVALAVAFAILINQVKKKIMYRRLIYSLFAVIPTLLIINLVFFQKWNKGLPRWYLVLPAVTVVFIFFLALHYVFVKYSRFFNIIIICVLILFTLIYLKGLPHKIKEFVKFDENTREHFMRKQSPETVFAGTDIGGLAFWGGRRVINLDGLVNSYEYQSVLKNQQLSRYLQEKNVSYLFVCVWADKPKYQMRKNEYMFSHRVNPPAVYSREYKHEYYVYSYMYNMYSDLIILTPEQEVYRSAIFKDGLNDARDLIFYVGKKEKD